LEKVETMPSATSYGAIPYSKLVSKNWYFLFGVWSKWRSMRVKAASGFRPDTLSLLV
jgi:hypothetical protein